jgi:uncharacterized protein (TIGR03437 family)
LVAADLPGDGAVLQNVLLTSGVAAPFSIPAANTPTVYFGDFGFRIQVPSGATRLEIRVSGVPTSLQFAIAVRIDRDIVASPLTADYPVRIGENPLVITPSSTPPLRAGLYFIGLVVLSSSAPVTGQITATITTGSTPPPPPPGGSGPTVLTSGTPRTFSLNALARATLFTNAYRIDVPAGATQLQIRLSVTTANVDADLFVRFGQDVALSDGRPVADYSSIGPTGEETLTITPSSSPPLRAGSYFIAIAVITTGVAIQGSVTATFSTAPAPSPAIGVSASTLAFTTTPGMNPPDQTFTVRNTGGGTLNFQVSTNVPWLRVSPDRGSSTGSTVTITASVNVAGLAAGNHSGEIRVAPALVAASLPGASQASAVTIQVTLTIGAAGPSISAGGAVNAASNARNAAAEMILSLYGANLASGTAVAQSTPLPTTLAGTSVRITDSARTDRLALLFFVSPGQINLAIPEGVAAGQATITVVRDDGRSASITVQIDPTAPGLFTANADGRGVPAALAIRASADGAQTQIPVFQCGSAPGSCTPAPLDLGSESDQVILLLFGTGIRGRSSLGAVRLTIGGTNAEVLFAGPQGAFVGLDQVNARVPRSLIGRGEVDAVLTVDGRVSNTVRVHIGGTPAGGAPPPAGLAYLPLATGMSWTYRVTFSQSVRLPYEPVFEATGLLCTSIHCGFRTWNAGTIEFQMTVGDAFADPAGGDSFRLSVTGQGNEFFFGNRQDRLEIRVRSRDGADQLELVGFLAFRNYRPLARFQPSNLASTQTLTVPAGTFENVVRTTLTLSGGSSLGNQTWTTEVFLAPNTGIVRAVMRDSAGAVLYTQELTAFASR